MKFKNMLLYNSKDENFIAMEDMIDGRSSHALVYLNNNIYSVGGFIDN